MFNFLRRGGTARARSSQNRGFRRPLEVECLEARQVLSAAVMWQIGNGVYDLTQTFALHSNPAATHTIYLDFDGYTTGDVGGTTWDNLTSPAWDYSGNGPSFTNTEKQIIQRIWTRVAEDYAPFNVDVTTQDPGVEALRYSGPGDDRWGIRAVITPDDRPAPGAGGVAYVGSFNFTDLTPVYVFNTSEKDVAEAVSHEVGHSLGLNHDGTATLAYFSGQGSGATAWGPIMGASYTPNVTQWSKGEYAGANNQEDDLALITTRNGFSYRPDDYGDIQAGAFALLSPGASVVSSTYGIIERNTDADWFSFWANSGAVALKVDPLNLGPNLAVRADLYSTDGTLLTTVNPAGVLNAAVNFTMPAAGEYFLRVTGIGKGNPLTTGFTNYASLGNYRITGSVPAYTGSDATNVGPIANPDSADTPAGAPVAINVLANDSDPAGGVLTLLGVDNVVGGNAIISGSAVLFTPAVGFTGTASFSYRIADGQGATASADAVVNVKPVAVTPAFTNDTNVVISPSRKSTVTSAIKVAGLSGTIQDVNVTLNLVHTSIGDLKITLISPAGTRIVLFNRNGGSGDNLLNTTFDDAASAAITSGAAPFSGSFRPVQLLSTLNGKNPNGVWKLEVVDAVAQHGGYLDNWTLSLEVSAAARAGLVQTKDAASWTADIDSRFVPPAATIVVTWISESLRKDTPASPDLPEIKRDGDAPRFDAIKHWLIEHAGQVTQEPELDLDFPAAIRK